MSVATLLDYMGDCRTMVLEEMRGMIPKDGRLGRVLYDLVFDYPLRDAKALRPALCVATCCALGGSLEAVSNSATVIELFHNAFLIHDDIEDGSEKRRSGPTLHRMHGLPVAINVGDAMFALTLEPLLENTRLLDLGRALRILKIVARMVRESAEGQALELAWIRDACWAQTDRDYLRMVHKKTSHYTFITPVVVGAVVAGEVGERLGRLRLFATALGAAFQIQDDVLNLAGDEDRIGKELDGDLWEGKHTLVLLHAVRSCTEAERRRATAILRKRRPFDSAAADRMMPLRELVDRLRVDGQLSARSARVLARGIDEAAEAADFKTVDDVLFLRDLIRRQRSIDHARAVALRRAQRARRTLTSLTREWPPSVHRDFLHDLTTFVIERDH
ncbi:MAG TPA: polyprenyl synthetase family protein [Polyangiaceae bacterium]|jgi:geranylgeranyl diphosphate synthase, type II|nr:polyprenyl synthetase family protein [Polyangiaceae bacterium]